MSCVNIYLLTNVTELLGNYAFSLRAFLCFLLEHFFLLFVGSWSKFEIPVSVNFFTRDIRQHICPLDTESTMAVCPVWNLTLCDHIDYIGNNGRIGHTNKLIDNQTTLKKNTMSHIQWIVHGLFLKQPVN